MSHQQINLYRKKSRRSGFSLNLSAVAIGTAAVTVLLITLGLSQKSANDTLARQLQNLQNDIERLDSQAADLRQKLTSANTGNPEQRLQQLQQELARLQQVKGLMARQQSTAHTSFAEQMTGLSQNHLRGISLQQIHLLNGGQYLSLSGDAHPPQTVARYIQKLQGDERFHNARFGPLQMQRGEQGQGPVQFQLGEMPEVRP